MKYEGLLWNAEEEEEDEGLQAGPNSQGMQKHMHTSLTLTKECRNTCTPVLLLLVPLVTNFGDNKSPPRDTQAQPYW